MNEFQKRKKRGKRRQAHRQIMAAFRDSLVKEDFAIRIVPEIEAVYSTIDLCKAFSIQRERLRDWMVKGYILPSLPSKGQGTIAIFNTHAAYRVAVFGNLLRIGFKRDAACTIIDSISFDGHEAVVTLLGNATEVATINIALGLMKSWADEQLAALEV